jgi:drug/metabolite transporter (DMT)-like permease
VTARRRPAALTGPVVPALLVVYLLWGSVYVAVRVVVEDAPPLTSIGVRYVVAGAILAVVAVARGGCGALRLTRRTALGCLLLAVLLPVLTNGLVSLAESEGVPAGTAALLSAMTPVSIVVLRLAVRDRPPSWTLAGVVVGFAGLAVLLVGGGSAHSFPVGPSLVVVLSANFWALGSFLQPRLVLPGSALVTATYELLLGGLLLLASGLATGEPLTLDYRARTWWLLGLMTLSSTVAFGCYVWLLANAPISLVSTHAYVNPVVAVALGWLLLSEPVTAPIAVGGCIVVLAVVIVISAERPPRSGAPDRVATTAQRRVR